MTDDSLRRAVATLALEMSAALNRFAAELDRDAEAPTFSPVTGAMPIAERTLRQCLVLADIADSGGKVPQPVFYDIAATYGYSGRGMSGFFRNNKQGLLELRNGTVYTTKRGRDRLTANRERVDARRATLGAPELVTAEA